MSAPTSVFFRSFYSAAAAVASRAQEASRAAALRGLAAAVIAGAAVAPAMAQNGDSSESYASSAHQPTESGISTNGDGTPAVVKQIGSEIGSLFSGVGRFLNNASTSASAGAASAPGHSAYNPAESTAPTQGRVKQPDPSRIGPTQQEAYDKLAVSAAAHRLVAEASYENFANAREAFALSPKNTALAKEIITARKHMDRELAALNVAVSEFSYATNILAQRYRGSNFNGYKALQASISAPIEVRATEVNASKAIYKPAEALAIQIMAGEVPRATEVTPGGNSKPADSEPQSRRLAYRAK